MIKKLLGGLTNSRSQRKSVILAIASVSLLAIALSAICAQLLIEMRNSARDRAGDAAIRLATVLEANIQRNVESIDYSIVSIIEALKQPDIEQLTPTLRHKFLFSRSASTHELEAIQVTDDTGYLRLSSRGLNPLPANYADREYFRFHKTNDGLGLHISSPVLGRTTGQPVVVLSRRISRPDGSFGGVVSAALRLNYFKGLFANITLGPNSNVTLIRTDGIIMMRWPYDPKYVGLDLKHADLFKYFAKSRTGQFETFAKTDGVKRFIAYSQVGELPLIIGVGQSTDQIYSSWRRYVGAVATLAAILLLTIIALIYSLVRALSQRAKSEATIAAALENMPQGLCMFDQECRLVTCNEKYAELYQIPPEFVRPGTLFRDILLARQNAGNFPHDADSYIEELRASLADNTKVEREFSLKDERTIAITNCSLANGGWVATHEDVTIRKRAESDLANTKAFLDAILENTPIPVAVKDPLTEKFTLINRAYEKFLQTTRDKIIGSTVYDHFSADDARLISQYDASALRQHDQLISADFPLEIRPGETRVVVTTRIVVRDREDRPQFLIVVIDDVTDKRVVQERIAHLAHHDPLTDLANRALFTESIEESLARFRRYGSEFAVLLIDLDKFKAVNDTLGHQAGDALLVEVSKRLKSSIRQNDVAARLGGDEFAVIMQAGEDGLKDNAIRLATRLLDVIGAPYEIDGQTAVIGSSIGIALAPGDSTVADELMNYADLAMYKVKNDGRCDYRFYSKELNLEVEARVALERDLSRAVAANQFELFYQPIMDVSTGHAVCAEALVRWRHPERGLLMPDQFIPYAEECGLIVPMGEWILRRACIDAAKWPSSIKVAVNLSPEQFQKSDFIDVVMYALTESGLEPERLELEITESSLLERSEANISTMHQLQDIGVKVVLDDFGAGFSSLLYVQKFPFDKIKIDRSFVSDMARNSNSAAIVCAINGLAKGLGIVTVAEGVETRDQLELLRLAGCDQVQGYLFSEPAPLAELEFMQPEKLTGMAVTG